MEKDIVICVCIDIDAPGQSCRECRQPDLHRFPVGIDRNIDYVVARISFEMSGEKNAQDLI